MEDYDEFLHWAQDQGVELNGILPRAIPNRGIGLIVTKPVKANEQLLQVPTSALRTIETVRPKVKKALPKGTKVHAILAAELALDTPTCKYRLWNAVTPSRDDVSTTLPLAWDTALHAYLPKPALTLLRKQQAKFTRDWAAIQQASLDASVTRQDFLYSWLLVNTRTFYHESPRTAKLPKDDRMVLQPVADLFNHADKGCHVAFGPASFTITADRAYDEGEEVYICYGKHTNDFLLVEYGFVLAHNGWDEVCLDDAVLPELGKEHKARLDERGFLGNYVLDAKTVCYRTQVALRLLCAPAGQWERLVFEGEDGGEALQEEVDRLLVKVLRKYRGVVERTIHELEDIEVGQAEQRDMLCTRWQQIQSLVNQTVERLES
ncbi:ribosomal lysine N-methyltransferase set11 [Staphylotrichum tortipilum]|uniref:Ribosomal lysine N-methyltransferase set11 n=1 Tax=Staphylotrichum tortipilum TaxID=2831512 RepID=A0AAN6RWZ4_9PEZI|nr:ribosomal lysine N-methyltransferase set11 [Staphylotrichum longicolle]